MAKGDTRRMDNGNCICIVEGWKVSFVGRSVLHADRDDSEGNLQRVSTGSI